MRGGFSSPTRNKRLGVGLMLAGQHARTHFDLLQQDKAVIEREVGKGLEWHAPAGKKQCRIMLRRHNTDPAVREQWPEQMEWLREKLEMFHRVFGPRVKSLDALKNRGTRPSDEVPALSEG